MESLTKQELGEIFDIVNSTYLGMKGEKKRITKKACKLWKPENNLYKFLIALYNSDEINQNIREPIEFAISHSNCPCDWETRTVSWKTHTGYIRWRDERITELEKLIEDVEEGKGYLKVDEHERLIQETKDNFRKENSGLRDDVIKYKNESEHIREKMDSQDKMHQIFIQEKDKYIKSLEQNLMEK
jgi:hypothetical protein